MKPFLRTLLCLLLLAQALFSFSQDNFLPGYAVRNSGDTLRGLIARQFADDLMNGFAFKADHEADIQVFSPEEMAHFGWDQGRLFSSILIGGKRQFAECILTGNPGLFSYDREFYIALADSPAYHITLEGDIPPGVAGQKLRNDNYRALTRTLGGCPEVLADFQSRKETLSQEYHLIDAVKRCNAARGIETTRPQKKIPAIRLEPGVMLGYSPQRVTFETSQSYSMDSLKYSLGAARGITAGIRIFLPRIHDHIYLNIDGYDGSYTFEGSSYYTTSIIARPYEERVEKARSIRTSMKNRLLTVGLGYRWGNQKLHAYSQVNAHIGKSWTRQQVASFYLRDYKYNYLSDFSLNYFGAVTLHQGASVAAGLEYWPIRWLGITTEARALQYTRVLVQDIGTLLSVETVSTYASPRIQTLRLSLGIRVRLW